jgi:hypothetical protein
MQQIKDGGKFKEQKMPSTTVLGQYPTIGITFYPP